MATSPTTAAPIVVQLMGRFVVIRDGAEVPAAAFGGRKVRALVRVLAARRGHFVSHDELTEALWPERAPADPAANLQVLVTRARRAVGRPDLIRTGPSGYALTAEDWCVVDSDAMLTALRDCANLSGRPALAAWRRALVRADAEPLAEDRYADWAQPYRAQMQRVRQDAWERAAALAIDLGEPAVAVEYAAAAAAADPLREAAALTLVRALAAAGDPAAALAHYNVYRELIAGELGLDPSPAAVALQARLLDAALAPVPAVLVRSRPVSFEPLRLVGRVEQLEAIRAALQLGRVVRIAGRSGSGKSRLLAELAADAHAVSVRAFWADRNEPWTLARVVLRELVEADIAVLDELSDRLRSALASVLPEAEPATRAADFDPRTRRALVVEAAVRIADVGRGELLIVDDLQWADPTSLELLAAIIGRTRRLTLVVAYRPEETDGSVVEFLRNVAANATVELGPLSPSAIADLTADPQIARALTEFTDRTPIALSEVIRVLAAEGMLRSDADGRWRRSADGAVERAKELAIRGQRQAIAQRVAAVGDPTVLNILALLAREAPARVLAAAANRSEPEVLTTLASLSAVDLLRLGDLGWAFSHDMVGEVVHSAINPAERSRLAGALASVLDAEGGDPAERAQHWLIAGDGDRAAAAYAQAAARALDTFADVEAEQLADAGLGLEAAPAVRSALFEARAQARRRRGEITGARADLRAALEGYGTGRDRASVLAALASLASGADDLLLASELGNLAIVEARGDDAARAGALEVSSVIDMNLARSAQAAERAAEALAIYERLGDSRGVARILDARAMATFVGGDVRAGTDLLDRAAGLFEDSGDLMRTVTPRSTRGHGLVFQDRALDGLVDTERALDVARTLGHPEGQSYALWHRAEALAALGRADQAVVAAEEALAIATRIGHRGWTATAWRALGIGHQAAGDLDTARAAFDQSLEQSRNLDLFRCWAAARAALVAIAQGRLAAAAELVVQARADGPGLGQFEARWAQAELGVVRGDDDAGALVQAATAAATAGGALLYLPRLAELRQRLQA
jgi:DNA-binding SARP family transcriptional activator